MEIVWDFDKELRNKANHGLDFSPARFVFADPLAATVYDRFEGGEHRWHTIGYAGWGDKVLVVVHSNPNLDEEDDVVRVIGLREADPNERRRYEQGEPPD